MTEEELISLKTGKVMVTYVNSEGKILVLKDKKIVDRIKKIKRLYEKCN